MTEEAFDLYADLDEALIEPLQEEVEKKAAEERAKLIHDENFREKTEKTISDLSNSNLQLKKNISILLATAKSEIERKDQQIKDLRREMDEIIFRKNKGPNRKLCDKWTQTDKVESSDNQKMQPNRHNEFNKQHDRNKPKDLPRKEVMDSKKRRLSPEKKYSDNYRKSSNKEGINETRRNHDRDKNHKSNNERSEKTKSRSPDRYDKKKSTQKEMLREDDLRKVLLKNKTEEKPVTKERREKSSSRDDKKSDHKVSKSKEKSKKRDRSQDKEKSKKLEKSSNGKSDRKESSKKEKSSKDKLDIGKKVKLEELDSKNSEISKSVENIKDSKIIDKPVSCVELKMEPNEIFKSNLNLSAESEDMEQSSDVQKTVPEPIPVKIEKSNIDVKQTKYTPIETSHKIDIKSDTETPLKLKNGCESIEDQLERLESAEIKREKSLNEQCSSSNSEPITELLVTTEPSVPEINQPIKTEPTIIVENPVNVMLSENKINLSSESANDSFESTKENSLSNSMDGKKNKKRKTVTTEIESDGTVVWTITRKKRKIKEQS